MPEGRPPSQVFFFIFTLPTLKHIHSSCNVPSFVKLALSLKSVSAISSIQGQSGSNACTCTLIALTIAKLFYTFPLQSVDPHLQHSLTQP